MDFQKPCRYVAPRMTQKQGYLTRKKDQEYSIEVGWARAPRILVVDDNPSNISLIQKQLKDQNYTLITAKNGIECIEKVRKEDPDLVLLDLMMPEMSGYEACDIIKKDRHSRLIPVIIITALNDLPDKLKAIECGADDFLIKPWNKLELMTRIRSLLRLRALYSELESSENILFSLAQALEAKDNYTRGHSERVGKYAKKLAAHIGLNESDQQIVWRGALLHDIGKIGIKEDILHKPGPMNTAELEHIRAHPEKGYDICCSLKSIQACLSVIRNHHERFDGSGYPDKMKGEQIPLIARITSVVDSYDAMTTNRPYRKAMNAEAAVRIFRNEKNSGQWDPGLVDEFIGLIERTGF